ncbi:MAG: helix-turn-helix domain-containing protein [Sphingomonadales bacterium]|nr:helix-turn-helix domain-containing protein [Sphingomonadales bacterium]
MSRDNDFEVRIGSANVHRDHGDPDAEIKYLKAKLAGMDQADISRVRSADLSRFIIDRLVRLLENLDPTVGVDMVTYSRKIEDDVRVPEHA